MKEQLKIKLDKIFADYQESQETHELYDEVLANLEAHTEDLIAAGTDETLAIIKAFDEMGDLTEVLDELVAPRESENKNDFSTPVVNYSTLNLVNEQIFNSRDFSAISLNYNNDNVEILQAEDENFRLLEYMNTNNEEYLARINLSNGKLSIENGRRPKLFGRLWPFRSKIIFLIPKQTAKNLLLTCNSGNLKVSDVQFENLKIDLRSGNLKAENVQAKEIQFNLMSGNGNFDAVKSETLKVDAKSGNLTFGKIEARQAKIFATSGNVGMIFADIYELKAEVKSGNLKVQQLQTNCTELQAHSGNVQVGAEIFTKLKLSSHSGNAKALVNSDASFKFELKTGSGNTKIALADVNYNVKSQSYKTGNAGTVGEREILLETHSGNATIKVAPSLMGD